MPWTAHAHSQPALHFWASVPHRWMWSSSAPISTLCKVIRMPSISLFYFFSSHIPYNHADNKGLWDGQRVWATSSLLMSPCEKASPWMDKVLFPLDEILIFFLGLLHFPFLNNRKTGKKKSVCWIFRSNLQDENKVKTSLISFFSLSSTSSAESPPSLPPKPVTSYHLH